MTNPSILATVSRKIRELTSATLFFAAVLSLAVMATGAIGVIAMPMAENPPLVSPTAGAGGDELATP